MAQQSFYHPPPYVPAANSGPHFGPEYPPPSLPIHVANYISGPQYAHPSAPLLVTDIVPGPPYSHPSAPEPAPGANNIHGIQNPPPSISVHVTNYAPQSHYAPLSVATPVPAPIPVAIPIPIVGPKFCIPHPIDLAITRKVLTVTDGNFVVTDVKGNFMFKVKSSLFSLHGRRVILDAAGHPIVNLRQKIMTAHNRWEVFRGESSEQRDLIFTAKTSSMIQLKTKLDVFLAHNTAQLVCDYKVKGSWSERSCIVYAGDSSSIVAQMHKKMSGQSVLLGKDKFMVTVYPNIDFTFIVALIVILDDTNDD